MKYLFFPLFISFLLLLSIQTECAQAGNLTNDSFHTAKRLLEQNVYYDHPITLYCEARYSGHKIVEFPLGFLSTKYVKRSQRLEWEHAVPAENFGRAFVEWRKGDSQCLDSKGKPFKGRNCASKMNMDYRYMQADLHNLFPAVGSVNALRKNYNFRMLPDTESSFGTCDMHISNRKAQPPESARGQIARAYLYMDMSYKQYHMSKQQKKLMLAWNSMYPVTEWECVRESRIEKLQGNENPFVSKQCQ